MNAGRRRQQYVVNGRLVSVPRAGFSSTRFFLLSVLCLSLWITNPANEPYTLQTLLETEYIPLNESTKLPRPSPKRRLQFQNGRITNFGFFAVQERMFGVEFVVFGKSFDCSYNDQSYGLLCEALGESMTHQRPVLWDPYDRAYSAYRLLVWTLIGLSFLAFCFRHPKLFFARFEPFSSTLLPNPQSPVLSLLGALFQSSLFVYPALQRMNELVPLQSPKSLFHLFDSDDWNFWWSAITLLCIAATTNAITFHVARRYLLGWEAIVAASLGYFRGSTAMYETFPLFREWTANPATLTWTLLLLTAGLQSIPAMLSWVFANFAGHLLGKYQFENILLLGFLFDVWNGAQDVFRSLFGHG